MKLHCFHALLLLLLLVLWGCSGKNQTTRHEQIASPNPEILWMMGGKVDANQKVDILSTFTARILKISKSEGDMVAANEPVVELDRKEIKAQISALQNAYEMAKTNLTRAQTLIQNNSISQQQLESTEQQVKQAKAALDMAQTQFENGTIASPIAGVVTAVNAKEGEICTTSTVILSIVNPANSTIKAYLPENLAGSVQRNQKVYIKVSDRSDHLYHGLVTMIDKVVDPRNRSILVKILPSDFDSFVQPGMTVLIGTAKEDEHGR